MKFADKLFFATTAVLAIIFTIFGMWMLNSYFQRSLDREIEQGNTENQMFQYLFEMAYQTMQEYGDEYAVGRAAESAAQNAEKEGVICFVQNEDGGFLYGRPDKAEEEFADAFQSISESLSAENSYAYGIRKLQDGYYLVNICVSITNEQSLYLGICKDLTEIYEDRQNLIKQYWLALVSLLVVGGVCIYALSRYMTRPILKLSRVAGKIASGNYEQRSGYKEQDEIGELAASFNKMADRLVEQMQEKELEAKQKEDFTAAFAHELKTPLTSIIGYADMLNTISLSEEERQEATFYIYSQGKRLESLSHKLLELVSMEKNPMAEKAVSTKMLEENIRATMRPIFQKKNIKGKITLEKGVIYGDYELLLSLFYNLLDNAVKAVESEGFILMKGTSLPDGYEIKVVDNGRGIPKQEITRITEAFYMVDKSRSRKEGGAGIGMALCRRIIALHKGTMMIDSNLGEGTVIKLTFPKAGKDFAKKASE